MITKAEKLVNYQKYIALCGFALLVVLVFSYSYFLSHTVLNVVKRGELSSKINDLDSNIGQLENQSLTLKNQITPALASSLGFETISNPLFISRTASSKGLSLNQPAEY